MSESNGRGKSRLDRIEEMIERQEAANEAAHARFEEEDKRLLTSQILMNSAMQNMNSAMQNMNSAMENMNSAMQKMAQTETSFDLKLEKFAEDMISLDQKLDRFAEGMIALEVKMEETTGKLNALIDTVDGMIRKKAE